MRLAASQVKRRGRRQAALRRVRPCAWLRARVRANQHPHRSRQRGTAAPGRATPEMRKTAMNRDIDGVGRTQGRVVGSNLLKCAWPSIEEHGRACAKKMVATDAEYCLEPA
eukprot:4766368-Pleurochrysis_carterae.AAC.1